EVIPFFKTLKDNFEGIQKALTKEVKEMKDVFEELVAEVTHLQAQNDLFRAENDKIKQHYKELYDSIKITRAKHIEQVTKVTTKNMNLKTGVSKATVNPLVSVRDKHAIDVEPTVPPLRNNRNAHLDYLRHLKENVETIHDIVVEAKVVKPLDRSILAHIPLIKKKQVIVAQPSNKLDSTTHPHVVTVTSQKTNVPVPPSTGVDCCLIASGSQPMSHVKPNRISPAKGDTKLQIDDQPRKNKSRLRTSTRIDSSSRLKRTVDSNWEKQLLPGSGKITKQPNLQERDGSPKEHQLLQGLYSFLQPTLNIHPTVLGYNPICKKAGCYKCQLDEQWFNLTKETLREALQITPILWGIVTRANIDYAERIWEEFTQSIHTFIEDKQNLSRHTSGKKRATLIVIPSIRFTKLIIHHLQRKHIFHPRPDSPLHLSNEEPVLGYLKFSAKYEDADFEKAVKESMKDAYALPKGTLPPVVIREPELEKYQPLPEVPGKGKVKVSEEQVSHDLLSLQMHKKTSPADQYIFQRRVSKPTASSFHDESPYEVLGQSNSEDESKKIVLGVEKGGQAGPDPDAQAEDQMGSNTGAQAEGQAGSNPDETFEGQAGSNPDETSKGQAGPDPGNAKDRVQSTSSLVVYAGSDREHMDLDDANVSPQPSTEQLY
nr:hypothetical protein [Tanacetum cinerariifolium]